MVTKEDIQAEYPPGHRIGRYRVEEPVGQGGMGTVYAAFDETTNRNVAIKILAPGIPEALRKRFLAECEAQAKIRHPNVMPVYDRAWISDERPYFTMELLYEPITLAELLDHVHKSTLASAYPRLRHWNDTTRLIQDVLLPVAEGVRVANAEYRIQHRDLKPDNILMDIRTRRAYVIDFGICRSLDETGDEGKIVGTPRFLSPEQAQGRVDPRTDVWGLGCLLRYVISNEPPLEGSSAFMRREVDERIRALLEAEAKAEAAGERARARGFASRRKQLEDPSFRTLEDLYHDAREGRYLPLPEDVSPALAAIVNKAMAPDPNDRYADADGFVADLRAWLQGGAVQALSETDSKGAVAYRARVALRRHIVPAVGVAAGLLVGAIVGKLVFTKPPLEPDLRAEDVAASVQALRAAADADPGPGASDPLVLQNRDHHLLDRAAVLAARTAALDDADRSRLEPEVAALAARLAPVVLRVRGAAGRTWQIAPLGVAGPPVPYRAEGHPLRPGLYRLLSSGQPAVALSFAVPARYGTESRDLVLDLPRFPDSIPDGMTWIPGKLPGGTNGESLPGFLASVELVTNAEYAEWLDYLPPKERPRRVPSEGFERSDPSDSSRYLATTESENKPVTGVRPQDATAYAAWRSELHGISLRLPTDAEWRHMAGASLLEHPAADRLFPWRRNFPWRADAAPIPQPRTSACGVRLLYKQTSEIVRAAETGFGVKGEARGGAFLALPQSIERTRSVASDAPAEGAGFRVVVGLAE